MSIQRSKHRLHADTVSALRKRYVGLSLRALACQLGFTECYAATLSDVLHNRPGALSPCGERRLRAALGLKDTRDPRRNLHASPALYARLQAQRGDLTQEAFLTQLADLWDKCQGETDA